MSADVEARATRPKSAAAGRVLPALVRGLLWVLLGGWIGSWLLFALVVAPTAFRVLPIQAPRGRSWLRCSTRSICMGPPPEFALAALAVVACGAVTLRVALPLSMAAACLYTQFGVSAELAEIRPLVFGPEGTESVAARFNELHRVSVAIYSRGPRSRPGARLPARGERFRVLGGLEDLPPPDPRALAKLTPAKNSLAEAELLVYPLFASVEIPFDFA